MAEVQILIVEDEAIVAEDIRNSLENLGYVVTGSVSSGEESIERAHEDKPDLVLMDIMLQGEMDGVEAAHQIRSRFDIPVIFLTSCTDEKTMSRVEGIIAHCCISKPFTESELSDCIETVMHRHKVVKKLKNIFEKSKDLEQSINALVSLPEITEPYADGHQCRVACLAYGMAKELDLPHDYSERIYMAAVMHDIGKITIPNEILNKPSKLTYSEFSIVKSHATIGHDMLNDIKLPWSIADIICQHHERLDGSGYPNSLRESEIYLGSRILAVADVVAAMSSPRPYRPAHSLEETLAEINTNRDILYDLHAVDTCLHLFDKKGFKIEQ